MSGLSVMMIGPYPVAGSPVGGVESAVDGLLLGLSGNPAIASVDLVDFRAGLGSLSIEHPHPKIHVHRIPAQMHHRLVDDAASDLRLIKSLVAEVRPDVVHGQGVGINGLHATRLGLPSVVTVHGMAAKEARDSARGPADWLRWLALERVTRRVVRAADAVISISDYDRRSVPGLKGARRNVVIPNAISVAVESSRCPKSSPVALYAGVVIPRKNVVGLIRAFGSVLPALPHARLRLAGPFTDPAYRRLVEQAVNSHCPDSVDWLGPLDRRRIVQELSEATCMVLFSHQETLPVIIGEAMLCGCPVVSSAVGGVSEMLVDGETGLLVADGDEAALTMALIEVLSSRVLAERLGLAARERASRMYDVRSVAEQTVTVYEGVVR